MEYQLPLAVEISVHVGGGGLGDTSHVSPVQFGSHTHSQFVPLNCRYLPPGGTHFGGSVAVSRASNWVLMLSSVVFKVSMRPLNSVSLVFNPSSVVFKASKRVSTPSILAEIPTSPSKQYTSPSMRTFGVFKTISEYSPVVSTYTSPSWLFRVTLLNVSSLSTGFPETFVSPSKNHTAARDGPSVARARTLLRERN